MGKCKNSIKKEESLLWKSQKVSAKNNPIPTNSTPVSFRTSSAQQHHSNTVATQMFNDNQTPSTSWISNTKTNEEVEHPEDTENNLSITEKKQNG